MQRELGPLERRLLGALVLSVVLHVFLIANLKPASAQYAGSAFFPLHVKLADPAPGLSGAVRSAAPAQSPAPADAPKPEVSARKPGLDSRLLKN